MESYEQVLKTTKEAKTISAHITALGKIRAKTEDSELLKRIDMAIKELQTIYSVSKKGKSMPLYLDHIENQPIIQGLINYCNKIVETKKPEWQIIAEREGYQKPKS